MSLFFSDSVITRVYYILLLEDGLLFAFSASLSILLGVSRLVSLATSLSLSNSVITLSFILILILIPRYVTLHLRKTSLLVEDSCCRGGIVNIRCG